MIIVNRKNMMKA